MEYAAPLRSVRQPIALVAFLLGRLSVQQTLLDASNKLWQNIDMPDASTAKPMELLSLFYTCEEPAPVSAYLDDNAELLPVLLDAPDNIRQLFPDATLEVELSGDPESGANYLVVWIDSPLGPEPSIDRLMDLTARWWAEARKGLRGRLLLCLG